MRTVTGYAIAVVVIFAVLIGAHDPRGYVLNLFSAGFVAGMLGMYLRIEIYGFRKT